MVCGSNPKKNVFVDEWLKLWDMKVFGCHPIIVNLIL